MPSACTSTPWTTKGLGGGNFIERLQGLEMARTVLDGLGLADVPIRDTEVNYGNRRDNGHPEEELRSGKSVPPTWLAPASTACGTA